MEQPRPLDDGHLGDWVNERLLDHSTREVRAGSVVPTGFDRVVRVLHPPEEGATTWAAVARARGRVLHPLAQWPGVNPAFEYGGTGPEDPEQGSAPVAVLAAILEHCPADGELVYAVWDGFGCWEARVPTASLMPGWGGRSYRLFTGPKAVITVWPGMRAGLWPQTANLIWPADRAWCLATEIDWDFTLVAGSAALAERLLTDPRLEAFEVGYGDDLSWFGDTVNPRPDWLA